MGTIFSQDYLRSSIKHILDRLAALILPKYFAKWTQLPKYALLIFFLLCLPASFYYLFKMIKQLGNALWDYIRSFRNARSYLNSQEMVAFFDDETDLKKNQR